MTKYNNFRCRKMFNYPIKISYLQLPVANVHTDELKKLATYEDYLLVTYTYRIYLPYHVYQNTNCVFPMEEQNEKLHVNKQKKSY